ncbi:MAG: hypothetical protein HY902_09340 [Deltaproteobacteria bacterium]|nr:hypothetical protein [Deltaproteobacteria bacterium]
MGRAQRRLWWQTFALRVAQVLPAWLTAAAGWLLAVRLAVWPQAWDSAAIAVLAGSATLLLGWPLWQRRTALQVAQLLDQRAGTYDALATALWLQSQQRRDGWVEVQAQRAAQLAGGLAVAELVPWPRINFLANAAALALLASGVGVPLPDVAQGGAAAAVAPEMPSRHQGFATARDALGRDAAQLLTADVRLLRELEGQVDDPATRKWLSELRQVVEAVQEGRIDKRQALEQLAALEAARPHSDDPASAQGDGKNGEDADEAQRQRDAAARQAVADAAQKALDQAPEGEIKEELKKAAEQGDLGLMAKVLEKLAEKELSDKDIEKWRKTLEKFADALKDTKVPDKLKELAKKVSRLEQKRAEQGGLNPEQQSRLQEARHQLEQLRKEVGDVEGAKHQVQRLERQARMAADELRRQQEQQSQAKDSRLGKQGDQKGGKEGNQGDAKGAKEADRKAQKGLREAMRQAAGELRRQDDEQKARQAQRMGKERLRDVREGLSRGGNGDKQAGRGEQGEEGEEDGEEGDSKEGQGRQSKAGSGEPGQGGKPKAGSGSKPGQSGQDGQGQGSGGKKGFQLGQRGLGGKTRTDLINDGYEQRQDGAKSGSKPGTGKGDNRETGKDPGMQAARTEKVQGQHGDGPDVKKTFMEAAKKGFARRGWRDVYVDYSKVAEEMVDKEGLPAGRKALVRRYFEQIRPRD